MKALAERVLCCAVRSRRVLGGMTPDAVLAYHNVVPVGEPVVGDRSLHIPQAAFSAHLDCLLDIGDVVPLADLLQPRDRKRVRPRFAVTFDDAYRGALTAGVEELGRRGLPATVFVVAGAGQAHAFWWDVLADPESGLDPAIRRYALSGLDGRDDSVLGWAVSHGARKHAVPTYAESAGADEILIASRTTVLTVGSHTVTHPNLTRLSDRDLSAELVNSATQLGEQYGPLWIPHFAYPYGLFDSRVRHAVASAGYEAALRVDGGPIRTSDSALLLPRVNVPAGLSSQGLELRLAGLLRRWRRWR